MDYEDTDRTTLYISKSLLKEASFKSGLSNSKTVQMLLLDYVSVDGDIADLEREKKESDKIIKEHERRKKQLDKRIEELKNEQIANSKNIIIINECLESIDRFHSKHGTITVSFLKRLSKAKRVPFGTLNDLCLQKNYNIISD